MSVADKARRYEDLYPGTGITEAQKVERQERLDFKSEVQTLRRSNRNRGIVVPDLHWRRDA